LLPTRDSGEDFAAGNQASDVLQLTVAEFGANSLGQLIANGAIQDIGNDLLIHDLHGDDITLTGVASINSLSNNVFVFV
jgi:hypothetical protein